jgi:bifunctional NMN adenylyltransferase/nudix hydrolase
MKKLENNSTIGVIVGRFETPYLHEGHLGLINHVLDKHANVIIFLGIAPIQNTLRNPLDYPTRKAMIQSHFPNVIVLPLLDNRSDVKWSQILDGGIRAIFPDKDAILYGGVHESFIPHYKGKHVTEPFLSVGGHNATELRESAALTVLPTKDFRCGVIYGIASQRAVTYPTVDVVVANDKEQILLVRKPSETKFRFAGGFVDRTDADFEMAARRELYEETTLSALNLTYIASQKIDDWRYTKDRSGIMTTLFLAYEWDQMGRPTPSDDLHGGEVKWFNLTDLYDVVTEKNQGDGHVPKKEYIWKIEDKIVPEHVELMKTFIKKFTN